MAFFGLTTLGAQNALHEALKDRTKVGIFEVEEFKAAFLKLAKERIEAAAIEDVLALVYHGPAPQADVALCKRHLPATSLTLDAFLAGIASAQAEEARWEIHEKSRVSGEFASSDVYREYTTRHIRMKDAPRTKYNRPVTANMDIGWVPPAKLERPLAAKKSCDETVYAAELVKAGVYF